MSATHNGTGATHQFVVFHIGDEEYALPIAQIQEVIRYTQPRSVASADPWIVGVISLRGKIVPVGELSGRLGVVAAHGEDSKIVIVDTRSETVGVIVDSVDEVLWIEDEQLDANTIASHDVVRGIAKIDQRLLVVLEADALVSARALAA